MRYDTGYEAPDATLVLNAVSSLRSTLLTRGVAICISGMDGTGKTTAARGLAQLLDTSGVRVRHLHLYQWYINVLITPLLLLHNRYVGRRVLVFDRTIYDNLAVAESRRHLPGHLTRAARTLVVSWYPTFSYRFHLVAPFPELRRRRPDTTEARFATLAAAYEGVARDARCTRISSDAWLLGEILRNIAHVA